MSLKVIGVGGPRTGTSSLKVALEILGYQKCYHMKELLNQPEKVHLWRTLFDTGSTDFDAIFEGYQASSDFPGYLAYKALWKQYPDARFILTERDAEKWHTSVMNTVYQAIHPTLAGKLKRLQKVLFSPRLRKISKVFHLLKEYFFAGLYQGRFPDKASTIRIYEEFNEEVKRTIPAEQLLIFDIADGWEPLCAFLGKPVPDVAFPYLNKRENFKAQVKMMLETGAQMELK
ncbi:MAG: sulfotransferase [Saprospiraceae bacterium]